MLGAAGVGIPAFFLTAYDRATYMKRMTSDPSQNTRIKSTSQHSDVPWKMK